MTLSIWTALATNNGENLLIELLISVITILDKRRRPLVFLKKHAFGSQHLTNNTDAKFTLACFKNGWKEYLSPENHSRLKELNCQCVPGIEVNQFIANLSATWIYTQLSCQRSSGTKGSNINAWLSIISLLWMKD